MSNKNTRVRNRHKNAIAEAKQLQQHIEYTESSLVSYKEDLETALYEVELWAAEMKRLGLYEDE